MSTDAAPASAPTSTDAPTQLDDKGKGKATTVPADESMDDDDEEEEGDDDDEEDDDDEMEEDSLEEIDPTAIRSSRTRGIRVDYTSPEALAKAGLNPGDNDDDDDDAEENGMHED